jgi:hypothetical protein
MNASVVPEAWIARICRLDASAQLALVQRVLAQLSVTPAAVPTAASVREAALQLSAAEQAQLAQQLLLALAELPQAQLEATLAVEARSRSQPG